MSYELDFNADSLRADSNAPPPAASKVRAALDKIRPGLMADGGNVELVTVDGDGTIHLALQGACDGCPSASMTLRKVLEPFLRAELAGVAGVTLG